MSLCGEKIVVIKDTTCTTCMSFPITNVDIFEIPSSGICIVNSDSKSINCNINHV